MNLEVVVFLVSTTAEVEATHPEEEDHGGVEDLHQPGCQYVGDEMDLVIPVNYLGVVCWSSVCCRMSVSRFYIRL